MDGVHFVAGTPNAYIHEDNLLDTAGEWIGKYGSSVFIVTGRKSWEQAGTRLTASMEKAGVSYHIEHYRGECSYEEVARLGKLVPEGTELIVGVGAGKVIDTAKKLSIDLRLPLVAVPTLAATCAPVSNLSVMYTEEGVYIDFRVFYRNTLLVLVDTGLIAGAPVRYLAAGIGDTIAKWYETLASSSGVSGHLPTVGGIQAAKICYETLLAHSAQALEDAKAKRSSKALQQVIDAIFLFSGLVAGLGEDNCRSAAAHAVHNGLTAIPEMHHAYHGEKVAYGILVQLALEKRPMEEVKELLDFYTETGLPANLKQLGLNRALSEDEMAEVIRIALSPQGTMGNMPFEVTSEALKEAIFTVEDWSA
ncbi:iron-containing alcohol dehydrogenase family protein [Paenibacillus caui]|uniref:iron-containing alcohol dehydrogenase family protein n=1 Tax=Paenibacillus caui TaxID=2873927 RepID=UPI001CA7F2EC